MSHRPLCAPPPSAPGTFARTSVATDRCARQLGPRAPRWRALRRWGLSPGSEPSPLRPLRFVPGTSLRYAEGGKRPDRQGMGSRRFSTGSPKLSTTAGPRQSVRPSANRRTRLPNRWQPCSEKSWSCSRHTCRRGTLQPVPLRSAIDLARLPGTILPDLACLPVGARLVSVDGARELLPRMPGLWAHGLQRELVMARLYEGDLALATAEAEDLARHGDPAHPWAGHRTIGYWLARHGEAQEFFKRWKTYGAAHERGDMRRIKELLQRVIALDPRSSKDVMRARDTMLLRLWTPAAVMTPGGACGKRCELRGSGVSSRRG